METSRLLERTNNPKFIESDESRDVFLGEERSGSFQKTLEATKHYDEITLFGLVDNSSVPPKIGAVKYTTSLKGEKLALLDTLIDLSYDADHVRVRGISLREIDSFLRDDNTKETFSSTNALIPLFEEVKKTLGLLLEGDAPRATSERRSPDLNVDYKPEGILFDPSAEGIYQELDANRKLDVLDSIIEKYIAPHLKKDGGAVEAVFADDFLVVIDYRGACTSCNKSLTTTMDYIQRVFQLETKHNSLRVITDS